MVKVDLITGFLGAGKTTFLLKYAKYLLSKGEKIGILEYDYGAVNVDMLLLRELRSESCELEMLAAACDEDCLKRRFKTKLIAMAMSGYNRVIIEPSGVFDMDMFFDALRDEPLENWYEIDNVITIVNANLKSDLGEEADFVLASQASSAGCIVLSRTQLSNEKEVSEAKAHIEASAEKIKCRGFQPKYFEKDWETLNEDDFQYLSHCGYHVGSYVKTVSSDNSTFSSVSFLHAKMDIDKAKQIIGELLTNKEYGSIFRIKGFASENGINYEIQATNYETELHETAKGQGVLIVIGSNINESKIKELIET